MRSISPLSLGATLAEYRIDAVLGSGAFAITYCATDTQLGMNVAIKEFCPAGMVKRDAGGGVLLRDSSQADGFRWCMERFVGEGQVLAQFKHPNIVRVSRYFAANGTAYIVMDYEDGRSLASLLETESQPMEETRLLRIFAPLLDGLCEVHRKRWLHRDIKPGNIFLRGDDSPLLIDFGAAEQAMRRQDDEATLLTPGYAAVEQYASDARESPATDLYGLGATMYRCVTGRRPADAAKRLALVNAGKQDPVVPMLRAAGSTVSASVLEVIGHMLALEPEARPASADSILTHLQPLIAAAWGNSTGEFRRSEISGEFQRPLLPQRLLFTGPPGGGKVAALQTLCGNRPERVDARSGAMPGAALGAAAGSMDFGLLELAGGDSVEIYATRGQEFSKRMRDVLRDRAMGLVLMLDNSRLSPFHDLDFYLTAFRGLVGETRVVIGVTGMDAAPRPSIADYHRHLLEHPPHGTAGVNPPVIAVDAGKRGDVALLLQVLVYSLDPGVKGSLA